MLLMLPQMVMTEPKIILIASFKTLVKDIWETASFDKIIGATVRYHVLSTSFPL